MGFNVHLTWILLWLWKIEFVDHFFLICNIYILKTEYNYSMAWGNLGFYIGSENILFGNASFENDKNFKLFLFVQKYILNSDLSSKFIYCIYIRRQRPCIYVSVFVFKDKYYTKLTLIFQPIELFLLSSIFAVVVIHIICICNILSLLMFIYVPEKTS